jgi:hypothetical protein
MIKYFLPELKLENYVNFFILTIYLTTYKRIYKVNFS